MLDRQDIDALLVGSLYGELSSAEQARLTAHLESHPGDRTTLDDLQVARKAIRESRIFELQLDPPQAISALLLQEAARRAPKVKHEERTEGWFSRFVRSFVAHPAMAAAATLVLVVGVAGTLYMRGNDEVASPTVSQPQQQQLERGPVTATADPSAGTAGDGVAAGSASVDGYAVALADGKDKTKGGDRGGVKADPPPPSGEAERFKAEQHGSQQIAQGSTKATTPAANGPAKKKSYVEVGRAPEETPKDLPETTKADIATAEPKKEAQTDRSRGEFAAPGITPGRTPPVVTNPTAGANIGGGGSTNGVVAGNSAPQPQAPRNSATPAPPPPPASVATEKNAPDNTNSNNKTVAKKPADDAKNEGKADPVFAWAKDQHDRIIQLVRANKCADAAPLAVNIRNRAPDYYNSYVATDRTIKQCMSYINEAAEKDAERSQKSKPAKRADTREASPPAPAPAPSQTSK